MPPIPSEPARMPMARKRSRIGMPKRSETLLAMTLVRKRRETPTRMNSNEICIKKLYRRKTKQSKKDCFDVAEATMGFEPMIRVLQTLALATWPRRHADRILPKCRGMVKFTNCLKINVTLEKIVASR